jgi:TolB-like protein
VLPLDNRSGSPEQEYFVAGIHEALITDLARIGIQKVIAKASADTFKGTNKLPRDIGRELGVDALVTGSVIRSGDRVQVSAQLVRAESGEVMWADRFERNAGDVLSIQHDIVGAIARHLRANISPEQDARLAAARPVNPAAHDAYLKGRFLYANFQMRAGDPKQLDAAITKYEEAIAIDPTYAPPYAASSVAHWTATAISFVPPKDTFAKARAAALKAVELDDTLAEAHAASALVSLWYDWNWSAAERESTRALELNPDSTDALATYQTYLTLVVSRFDEAAAVSQRIINVDPLNPFSRIQAAWIPHFARRYDESIRAVNNLLDVYPDNVWARYFLALNYGAQRKQPEVRAECRKVVDLLAGAYNTEALAICAWALGVVGDSAEARRLLERLEHPPAGVLSDPSILGQAYAAVGDLDRAIELFKQGMDDRNPKMIYMKVGPMWDAARADPRFQAILGQMNFPRS